MGDSISLGIGRCHSSGDVCTHPASTPDKRIGLARRSGSSRFGLLGHLPIPREQVGDSDDQGLEAWQAHQRARLAINAVHIAGLDRDRDSGGTIAASILSRRRPNSSS
jgi:hypothetical protein